MIIRESAEDYLEMMLMLRESKGIIRSIDIAKELGVTKPSVCVAVRKLREDGYISMEKNGEIYLTDSGESIAKSVYDKHITLCSFLHSLGVKQEIAHKDACKMEHDLSPESIKAIKKYVKDNNVKLVDCTKK